MNARDSSGGVRRLLDIGAEMAAEGAAAAIGLCIGGAHGEVLGAALSPALSNAMRQVVGEFAERTLSKREARRIGTVLCEAATVTQQRLARGDEVRSDGFLDAQADKASAAEEIFESVLLKAKQEAQEHKLKYLANAFANAAFSKLPTEDLHAVITIAERMSYRQYGLLALAKRCDEFGFDLSTLSGLDGRTSNQRVQFLVREWSELRSPAIAVVQAPKGLEGPRIFLTSVGEACFELLGLSAYPAEEIRALVALVRR